MKQIGKRKAWNNRQKEIACFCGKRFLVSPCRASETKFCSRECYWENKKGRPAWNKGKKMPSIASKLKGIKRSGETKEKIRQANLRKAHTVETRIKMSKTALKNREKSHLWRGDINLKNDAVRHSIEYRLWREAVFARDNYTCQRTGVRGGKLHAHHIKNFAQYPELRTSIENGVTLSDEMHKKFHKKYGMKNNTQEQLDKFLCQ